ncbi:MAG: glycosyltransferase [Stomatobaculum sp.]|nr:glycosyltransferase [Stomatobaculum sp.]
MTKAVDVIIPVYRPDDRFFKLMDRLAKQTVRPHRIILMNTEESLWEMAEGTAKLRKTGAADLYEIHHLKKADFDHGGTRNLGVSFSTTPYFVLMTQDAVPQDRHLLEDLLRGMKGKVRMCYARQLAGRNADPIERFSRGFNYGPRSRVKTMSDLPELGIKTWFASNVCAAYDRSVFDRRGGFANRTIFNEDMIYCAGLLKAGYAVRYCANARVIHSHHFTGRQQLQRNFDLAVSQVEHPEVFEGIISESEGIKMVWNAAKWLRKQGRADLIPELVWTSGCKYLGYRLGKAYRKLPMSLVKRISGNRSYWETAERPETEKETGTAGPETEKDTGTAGRPETAGDKRDE